ncbi:MAG: hypothetical protein K0Q66_1419 [Chitinophagaceae bacterium]|nr:hypothetical protein [Chitinophagaceae bacterium]
MRYRGELVGQATNKGVAFLSALPWGTCWSGDQQGRSQATNKRWVRPIRAEINSRVVSGIDFFYLVPEFVHDHLPLHAEFGRHFT